jgi:ankyrin repeat protein
MKAMHEPIWRCYLEHRDLDQLRDEVPSTPWYKSPEEAGDSLLMRAVEQGDAGAAKVLMALGESPSLPARDGFTFLHKAIDTVSAAEAGAKRDAALEVIVALLTGGADPNVQGVDGAPLHRAAGAGLIEAARMLLAHGANIEARMRTDGELTPLMHAASMNQPAMVRYLLDAGADRLAISGPSLVDAALTLPGLLAKRKVSHANEILDMLGQ